MQRVTRDGHHVNRFRLMRMHVNRETEIRRQIAAHLVPLLAGVVRAHHVPVLLHEQHVRPRRVQGDAMNAMSHFRVGIGQFVRRFQSARNRFPGLATVIRAKTTAGGNGNVNPLFIFGIEQNRVHAHAARAGLPEMALGVAQPGKFLPRFAAVGGFENRRVLRAG